MKKPLRALLGILADGVSHSSQALSAELGVSLEALGKLVLQLAHYGIDVSNPVEHVYRLNTALELLDLPLVEQHMGEPCRSLLGDILVFDEIDSTNAELMRRLRSGYPLNCASLAEYQSAGRGRRGRNWQTPFSSAVCFSVAWNFQRPMSDLAGLGLALGVAAAEALQQFGLNQIGLKWPNDLVVDDHKLGGILIEVRGEVEGPSTVVAGIGLNFALHQAGQVLIDQPWTDMQTLCGGARPERNQLIGQMLQHWVLALTTFARYGFEPSRRL